MDCVPPYSSINQHTIYIIIHSKYFAVSDWLQSSGLILHNQLAYSWLLRVGSVSSLDDNDNAKNNWFNKQNNCSARASRLLVHFFDVNYTTTTRNLLHVMRRFMEDANIRRRIILLLLKAG